MNERERIAAIDALTKRFYPIASKRFSEESLRDSTVNILRQLHGNKPLQGYDVCAYLLQKHWTDATPQEAAICENASQAMREVIEEV